MSLRVSLSLKPKALLSLETAMAEVRLKQPWIQVDLLRDMLALRQLTNGPSIFEIARTTDLSAQTVRRIDEQVRPDAPRETYKSVFISYGGPDATFAKRLYENLMLEGVHAFYFPETATPGNRLHREMNEAVYEYDVILTVCSERAVTREGWLNELEQTLTREAAEGGADLLVPVLLDSFVLNDWKPEKRDLARQVRSRVAADFRTATDDITYRKELSKLLRALIRLAPKTDAEFLAQAERQRQATRPGLAVRGTFSPARAWRPAVVARLARTLGRIHVACLKFIQKLRNSLYG